MNKEICSNTTIVLITAAIAHQDVLMQILLIKW